jgi:hypothetical protein
MTKNIVIISVISFIVIIILVLWMNNKSESFNLTPTPSGCPSLPPQPIWYDTMPVQSIISQYSGMVMNVEAITGATTGSLSSNYYVIINIGTTGVLLVNPDGTFSKGIKDKNNLEVQWKIKQINNAADFQTLKGGTTPNPPPANNPNYTYPYYIVISQYNNSPTQQLALQYENGSISVRPLGDYTTQQWKISQSPVAVAPANLLGNTNPASNFGSGYSNSTANSTAMLNAANNSAIKATLDQILSYVQANNINAQPSQSVFGSSNSPLTVNVRLGANTGRIVSGTTPTPTPATSVGTFIDTPSNSDVRKLLAAFNNKKLGITTQAFNGLCTTPNMSDYISKTGIPCAACANF